MDDFFKLVESVATVHQIENARSVLGNQMDNSHITKNDKLWALTKEGAQRASKTASTKAEITALAGEFLQGKNCFAEDSQRGQEYSGRKDFSS